MKAGLVVAAAAAATLALAAAPALSQDVWPSRPVKIVVPSSPGGGTDWYGRFLAQALSESLKQQFVVENRPGASGNIGADAVAKAAPDGYTFLVSANPALTVNPSLYKNLPYNVERDLAPITRGVIAPMCICVHPSVPAKTLADLVAIGKREPGKLAFGSAGTGSPTYLGIKMLEEQTGASFLHIPYKGMGQAYQDFLGGQVQFMLADIATALPFIRSGKAVAIAVTDRTSVLPNVPSIADAGYPKVDAFTSFSVMAPAGTPAAIVQRMSVEIAKAMKAPAHAQMLDTHVILPVYDTPESFAASLKKERDGWADFIKRNGIKPD